MTMSNGRIGTTIIDAGCIQTGTIAADHIDVGDIEVDAANITGTLTANNVKVEADCIAGKIAANHIDADSLEVDAANIVGTLTAGQIDATELEVDAANITGTLSASQINTEGLEAEYISAGGASDDYYAAMDSDGLSIYMDGDMKLMLGKNYHMDYENQSLILGADNGAYVEKYHDGDHKMWIGNENQSCGILFNFDDSTYEFRGEDVTGKQSSEEEVSEAEETTLNLDNN